MNGYFHGYLTIFLFQCIPNPIRYNCWSTRAEYVSKIQWTVKSTFDVYVISWNEIICYTQCKIFAAMLSMDFQGYLIIQILFFNECSIYNFTIQWIWLYENLDVMIHSLRDDIGYPGTWQSMVGWERALFLSANFVKFSGLSANFKFRSV